MNQKQHIVAIEIGSSKVVGAVAEKIDNTLAVKHLEEEKLINCVNYGQVQNVENIKSSINRILHKIEMAVNGTVSQVYVGVGGRSLHSIPNEVNRSIDAQQSISETTISSIIKEASRSNAPKRYETVDIVPRAYYVDKVLTENPVGHYGSSIKIKYNTIVASNNLMLNLDRVSKPLNPKNIVTTLAMGEHILNPEEKRLGCMLVDMGAETTTVAIYKDGMLVYVNTLPLGGRNLTLDIANGLSVLEETAERVKKNINNPLEHTPADSVIMEGISSRDAANYINARAGEILANINKQLEFAGMNTSAIPHIVLTGGAAQLKGIAKKLEETTKIAVRQANMPANVNFDCNGASKAEYVQIMSLIAEAARTIDSMGTCVKLHHDFSDGGFEVNGGGAPVTTQYTVEPPRQDEKKNKDNVKKGKSWWGKFKDRVESSLMKDPEEDE